jgi:hypothetical protein
MVIKKITCGFVIQTFDTDRGENVCTHQEFIAGDPVDFEDANGEVVNIGVLTDALYQPFDMKQPEEN